MISGAIFTEDQKDSSTELAFKYAVYRINKEKSILTNTTLVYDIQYVPKDDSFRSSKKGNLSARPKNTNDINRQKASSLASVEKKLSPFTSNGLFKCFVSFSFISAVFRF